MSTFDPNTVRKAVEEFTPRRPQKFHDLLPAKDVVAELRQRRASYRSIADLLTQHCLPIRKTSTLKRLHADARLLDLNHRRGLDGIFDALEKANLVVMVPCCVHRPVH